MQCMGYCDCDEMLFDYGMHDSNGLQSLAYQLGTIFDVQLLRQGNTTTASPPPPSLASPRDVEDVQVKGVVGNCCTFPTPASPDCRVWASKPMMETFYPFNTIHELFMSRNAWNLVLETSRHPLILKSFSLPIEAGNSVMAEPYKFRARKPSNFQDLLRTSTLENTGGSFLAPKSSNAGSSLK
ncbi:hypothetical protein SADUNF_Sadunf16G0115600 [Salix dunnii]|uniref:Uncharacterized protein n=1 Tax=Salix dunnii TaxID=1413687 RepID=A0A835J870_9ROSI|nr:hypothetical protein SADUNF_Sadunf16G0115600 [Salix dunnii]